MQEKLRISMTTWIHFLVDFTCAYWMFYMILRQYNSYISCLVGEILVDNRIAWILVYNFCAFALQLPVGWIVDRFVQKRSWWISSLGCLVLAIDGVLILGKEFFQASGNASYYTDWQGVCYAVLLGIGNAFFHVGAGVEILRLSAKRGCRKKWIRRGEIASVDGMRYCMTPVGIFVSSGAFGLCAGQLVATHLKMKEAMISDGSVMWISFVMIGLMLAAAGMNLLTVPYVNPYRRKAGRICFGRYFSFVRDEFATDSGIADGAFENSTGSGIANGAFGNSTDCMTEKEWEKLHGKNSAVTDGKWNGWMIALLFLIVVLRSFQGGVMKFSWNTGWKTALIFSLCITLGKALGGILADRIGVLWTVVVPLACSAIVFWIASDAMIPGLIAVLLFQTTMPITMSLMHRQVPGYPGMVFGLLSFGLFLGSFPKTFIRMQEQGVLSDQICFIPFLQKIAAWENICSIVAVISLLLFLILLWSWKRKYD